MLLKCFITNRRATEAPLFIESNFSSGLIADWKSKVFDMTLFDSSQQTACPFTATVILQSRYRKKNAESNTLRPKRNADWKNISFSSWESVQKKATVRHRFCRREIGFIAAFCELFSNDLHPGKLCVDTSFKTLDTRSGASCVWRCEEWALSLLVPSVSLLRKKCFWYWRSIIGLSGCERQDAEYPNF